VLGEDVSLLAESELPANPARGNRFSFFRDSKLFPALTAAEKRGAGAGTWRGVRAGRGEKNAEKNSLQKWDWRRKRGRSLRNLSGGQKAGAWRSPGRWRVIRRFCWRDEPTAALDSTRRGRTVIELLQRLGAGTWPERWVMVTTRPARFCRSATRIHPPRRRTNCPGGKERDGARWRTSSVSRSPVRPRRRWHQKFRFEGGEARP